MQSNRFCHEKFVPSLKWGWITSKCKILGEKKKKKRKNERGIFVTLSILRVIPEQVKC
jgi:hypothetical protein